MDRSCATNWPGTCSCCRIPVTDMFAAASCCTLSERILLISREKLFRLTDWYIRNTWNFTLVRATSLSLSRASTFRRRRERKRSRKEEEREYSIARRKFVQGIDSMFPKRSELGLRDRTAEERGGKRGSCTFFASF